MIRTRVAPSPTGYPHIGTAYQALFDYVYARKDKNGRFVLRIEDTDRKRCVAGSEKVIYDSLAWLGLNPDEGPVQGGSYGPYRQSERLTIYQEHAQKLVSQGQAYYCFCSPERLTQVRKAQQQKGQPPMYDRLCRKLDPDEAAQKAHDQPHVIRLKVPTEETIVVDDLIRGPVKFAGHLVDDQVLIKTDGFPTYHLAVVVDDHLMKITHTVRGEEWLPSAPKHVLLYRFFGWEEPKWVHPPLLRNPDRGKISKRHGHTNIFWYRDQGYLPEAVLNFIALTVWGRDKGQEVFDIPTMVKEFKFEDIRAAAPIMDLTKMDWLNGVYIRNLSPKNLYRRLVEFDPDIKNLDEKTVNQVLPLVQERMRKLSEFRELTDYFFTDQLTAKPDQLWQLILTEAKHPQEETRALLKQVTDQLTDLNDTEWRAAKLEKVLRELQTQANWKPRPFFMTIRIAVTGKTATPPLFDVLEVLEKQKTLKRLRALTNQT